MILKLTLKFKVKETSITNLKIGQTFVYDGKSWEITDDSYPFPCAKCLSEQHEHDTMFANFEKEWVEDGTSLYEYKLEKTSRNNYQLRRK